MSIREPAPVYSFLSSRLSALPYSSQTTSRVDTQYISCLALDLTVRSTRFLNSFTQRYSPQHLHLPTSTYKELLRYIQLSAKQTATSPLTSSNALRLHSSLDASLQFFLSTPLLLRLHHSHVGYKPSDSYTVSRKENRHLPPSTNPVNPNTQPPKPNISPPLQSHHLLPHICSGSILHLLSGDKTVRKEMLGSLVALVGGINHKCNITLRIASRLSSQ